MTAQIKVLVAMDAGVDQDVVQSALPSDATIQIVGLVDGLEESWATLQETPADLLVVACAGYSDRALFLIDGAVRQRPERPVLVLTQGSANGFVRRVFESGADDILTLERHSLAKHLWAGLHVAVQPDRAVLREDADVHGAGMQDNAAV